MRFDVDQCVRQLGAEFVESAAKFGTLNYAVNNAGVSGSFVPTADMPLDAWRRVVGINLDGIFYGLKYEFP